VNAMSVEGKITFTGVGQEGAHIAVSIEVTDPDHEAMYTLADAYEVKWYDGSKKLGGFTYTGNSERVLGIVGQNVLPENTKIKVKAWAKTSKNGNAARKRRVKHNGEKKVYFDTDIISTSNAPVLPIRKKDWLTPLLYQMHS